MLYKRIYIHTLIIFSYNYREKKEILKNINNNFCVFLNININKKL